MGIIRATLNAVGGALADQWLEVIEEIVPPKTLAANQKAFMLGRAAASN